MRSAKEITLFIALLFGACATHVAAAACNGIRCDGAISQLYVRESGTYIQMDQDMTVLNCTLHGGVWITLPNNYVNRDAVLSVLLAAHAARAPDTRVRIVEGTNGCNVDYVISGTGN